MDSHASLSTWIRSHRRFVAIIVALALAFTIVAALVTAGVDADGDLAADGDGSMVVAGLTWSRMPAPDRQGRDLSPMGLTWS
jgi:hypothetical protein